MNQMPQFIIPRLDTPEQKIVADNLSIIRHDLGFNLIKVAQMDANFNGCQGIVHVMYRKKRDADKISIPKDKYAWKLIGDKIDFVPDPYPVGEPIGTGKVVYLIDDEEPAQPEWKSGAAKGRNREFLATHFNEGIKIIDPEIEKDVKQRYDNIMKKLEEERPQREAIRQRMQSYSDTIEAKMRGQQAITVVEKKVVEEHTQVQNDSPEVEALKRQLREAEEKTAKAEREREIAESNNKELSKKLLGKDKKESTVGSFGGT